MTTTLCSEDNVIHKAGVNASSVAVASSALLTEFINQSEGVVVGETRIDWVADYADITSDEIKELLKECCASHAAKKVVAYDVSSYSSRREAELLIDMLHDEFTRTLKTLKDLDTQTLRSVGA